MDSRPVSLLKLEAHAEAGDEAVWSPVATFIVGMQCLARRGGAQDEGNQMLKAAESLFKRQQTKS
jgi:hypothetical protein